MREEMNRINSCSASCLHRNWTLYNINERQFRVHQETSTIRCRMTAPDLFRDLFTIWQERHMRRRVPAVTLVVLVRGI
jgi:hypothetical protein